MSGNQPEVWVSIATTDRPASLARLVQDLEEQAQERALELKVFVIDNGRSVTARQSTRETLAPFVDRGGRLFLEHASMPGGSIARSRRDQREQVRRAPRGHAPALIWMLDDDVRLEHQLIENGQLLTRRIHNHLGFLLELKRSHPELQVLLGEVNGDPPIPAIATYASRLEDLLACLRSLAGLAPNAPWPLELATSDLLAREDDYYDFGGSDRKQSHPWIPRGPRARAAEVAREIVSEAAGIPFGIAFSRPLVANERGFSQLREVHVRGASAVFFEPNAFLSHRYPSLELDGIETRRSDTVGATLFALNSPSGLRRSSFAVRHARPRDELPDTDAIARNLLADTWGAALSRAIVTAPVGAEAPVEAFLEARLARIDSSLARTRAALRDWEELGPTLPAWLSSGADLEDAWRRLSLRLEWIRDTVPGVKEGRLAAPWRERVCAASNTRALCAFARHLRENANAE